MKTFGKLTFLTGVLLMLSTFIFIGSEGDGCNPKPVELICPLGQIWDNTTSQCVSGCLDEEDCPEGKECTQVWCIKAPCYKQCLEPRSECENASGYCTQWQETCNEGYYGVSPMGCPLGRSGQCCLPKDYGCTSTGGTIGTASCCNMTGNFPNTCMIGPCGCSPSNSHEVQVCDCPEGKCFDGTSCVE